MVDHYGSHIGSIHGVMDAFGLTILQRTGFGGKLEFESRAKSVFTTIDTLDDFSDFSRACHPMTNIYVDLRDFPENDYRQMLPLLLYFIFVCCSQLPL